MSAPDKDAAPRRETLADGSIRVYFGARTIPLADGTPRDYATLRAPRINELIDNPDPVRWIFGEGLATKDIDRAALRGWMARLIIDHDLDIIGAVAIPAIGVEMIEAIADFFPKART